MLSGMTTPAKNNSFGQSALNLLRKHWFPLAVTIIAITFIALNRSTARVNFLFFTVDIALWLALTVAAVLGLLIGLFVKWGNGRD